MKTMLINKQAFWYANVYESTDIVDEYGNKTGEQKITYTNPVSVAANVSPARGTADLEQFGINSDYTKTIVSDDLTLPIDKSTIIWIGIAPDSSGEAGTVKHNYAVVGVAKSLNSMTIAVKEVSVS